MARLSGQAKKTGKATAKQLDKRVYLANAESEANA
jgi:hypothetical protein